MSAPSNFVRTESEPQVGMSDAERRRREKRFVDIPSKNSQVLALINRLTLNFPPELEPVVRELSFTIQQGEILGLVGESGCGKSITASAMAGLLPETALMTKGEIYFGGHPLHAYEENERRSFLGQEITMVYQDPQSALNPLMRVGDQVSEALQIHQPQLARKVRKEKVLKMLASVHLPEPEAIYRRYPHELSGGQRQRILMAIALINEPQLLICDEPTTALDVHLQSEILSLLKEVNQRHGTAILYISHDLHTVKSFCDRTIILYAGEIVEAAETSVLFEHPKHVYTRRLLEAQPSPEHRGKALASIPGQVRSFSTEEGYTRASVGCIFADRCPAAWERCFKEVPIWQNVGHEHEAACHLNDPAERSHLEAYERDAQDMQAPALGTSRLEVAETLDPKDGLYVKDLVASYAQQQEGQLILQGLDLHVPSDSFVGLAGVSGSGKTTLARILTGQMKPDAGVVTLDGRSLLGLKPKERRLESMEVQMIFQDPYASLHPIRTIGKQMEQPLRIQGERDAAANRKKVLDMIKAVGLTPEYLDRYPEELSGGQRQRVAIGMALITEPKLLIADEAVSSLDVSIQAQILNLLLELRQKQPFACLCISHDLDVLQFLCDRIAILHEGHIVLDRAVEKLYDAPVEGFAGEFLELSRRFHLGDEEGDTHGQ